MHIPPHMLVLTAAFFMLFTLMGCEQSNNHGHSHDNGHSHGPATEEQSMKNSVDESDKTSHKSIY